MTVSIVGCGWLGLPLAEFLIGKGHKVFGSTTQEDKLAVLREKGIDAVRFKLVPMPIGESFHKLFGADLLVINIPPGRKKNTPEFYEEQIKYLKYQLQQSNIKKVIFISSTSFYPNTNDLVDTTTAHDFDNGSSKAVVKGELQISQINQELIILRCGGLMGGERIPGKWFSGKVTQGANTPVNYIHRDDILRVIESYINKWPEKEEKKILNLVSPAHPTRKEVHEKMASKHGFKPPIWGEESASPSKVVDSDFKKSSLISPLDF
ncbi:epimerase [Roseivirga sp.]|uniref:epimerase n=1 Tax=Roseivirga sp. TaxID=1964215 RepID=UPI003B8DCA68